MIKSNLKMRLILLQASLLVLLQLYTVGFGGDSTVILKDLIKFYGDIPKKFQSYKVILDPDKDEPEWWAGAPSVVRDRDGIFWLACRMRTADAPRGLRGYEIRILRSEDGMNFEKIHSIRREDVPIPGFERPALLIDPQTKLFKLYGCGPWENGPWLIFKFADVINPSQFEANSAKPVIRPGKKKYERDITVTEYKDPFVFFAEGNFHCFLTGYIRRNERIFHFISKNGQNWERIDRGGPEILDLAGWHNFFVRPASILPLGVGFLFIYEGSNTEWYDPVYNIATGMGFTFDLHRIIDLTPDLPLIISSTPNEHFFTWRYSHWMEVDEEIWIYAEVAKKNQAHEIRLFRIKK